MADVLDLHVKRLEHLQAIITRLAGNSLLIKGWSITLVGAILSLALKSSERSAAIAGVAIASAALFWALDAYYLAAERGVRCLYNAAAAALQAAPGTAALPDLAIRPEPVGWEAWREAATRWVTSALYLALIVGSLLVGAGLLGADAPARDKASASTVAPKLK